MAHWRGFRRVWPSMADRVMSAETFACSQADLARGTAYAAQAGVTTYAQNGQPRVAYEQNTQQLPSFGFSSTPQPWQT
jgi:hypothetical protein